MRSPRARGVARVLAPAGATLTLVVALGLAAEPAGTAAEAPRSRSVVTTTTRAAAGASEPEARTLVGICGATVVVTGGPEAPVHAAAESVEDLLGTELTVLVGSGPDPSTDLHVVYRWPDDAPARDFGWSGRVDGRATILLRPILADQPRFAERVVRHELGHWIGLPHTEDRDAMDPAAMGDRFGPGTQPPGSCPS